MDSIRCFNGVKWTIESVEGDREVFQSNYGGRAGVKNSKTEYRREVR